MGKLRFNSTQLQDPLVLAMRGGKFCQNDLASSKGVLWAS